MNLPALFWPWLAGFRRSCVRGLTHLRIFSSFGEQNVTFRERSSVVSPAFTQPPVQPTTLSLDVVTNYSLCPCLRVPALASGERGSESMTNSGYNELAPSHASSKARLSCSRSPFLNQ